MWPSQPAPCCTFGEISEVSFLERTMTKCALPVKSMHYITFDWPKILFAPVLCRGGWGNSGSLPRSHHKSQLAKDGLLPLPSLFSFEIIRFSSVQCSSLARCSSLLFCAKSTYLRLFVSLRNFLRERYELCATGVTV